MHSTNLTRIFISERLNSFFFSVFEPPTSRGVVISAEANFKDVMTSDKVLAKLENLNSNKSAGVDQISTHALKMCAESPKKMIECPEVLIDTRNPHYVSIKIRRILVYFRTDSQKSFFANFLLYYLINKRGLLKY
ncbi:hypothetical protein BpHYR1_029075 [Brachionus plicatilis]|uniref:RNA-directed DNA polymerase from mobile element jockey-like n=1 Tax=Brachionus plicatilis TaxID=10195 RepID=A0A3M7RPT9_BRAPC|nr:hypothetical protein BpHYR1_029075 [Brachionus plicatilis]